MDTANLAAAVRRLDDHGIAIQLDDAKLTDAERRYLQVLQELVQVLARICEGKTVLQAFGSPGDWGYGTEIGKALAHAYGVRGY